MALPCPRPAPRLALAGATTRSAIQVHAHRTVVRAGYVGPDKRVVHPAGRGRRGEDVVDAPPHVVFPGAAPLPPPVCSVRPHPDAARGTCPPSRRSASGSAPHALRAGSRCCGCSMRVGPGRWPHAPCCSRPPAAPDSSAARPGDARRPRRRNRACTAPGCCPGRDRCPSGSTPRPRPGVGRNARSRNGPRRRSAHRRGRSPRGSVRLGSRSPRHCIRASRPART